MSRAGSSALNLRAELVSATRSARPQCRRRRLKRHWRGHVNVPNNAGYRSAREHYACTRRSGGVDAAIRRTHSRPTDDAGSIAADSSGRRPSSRREASQKSDCRGRSGREIASDSTGQEASTGPGYMLAERTLPFSWSGSDSRLRKASSGPAWKMPRSGAASSLQTEAVPMHESIHRGRSMARSKRIDNAFDLLVRQVQRATSLRSLWAVRLPPPGRRVGRRQRRGGGRDESSDLDRFTDRSGRCPETVREAAASRRRRGGRERPLPSSALRGLWTAIGPDELASATLLPGTMVWYN